MAEITQSVPPVDLAVRVYDATFDKPELETAEAESGSQESDLVAVVMAAAEDLATDMEFVAIKLGTATEEEEDSSARTYVAPLAICHPHDFYVNVDFASSVKVSKDRKSAMCSGKHWIKVVKTKVYGTHGGDLRKISPHH